jgi:WD40 repeat protein
MTEREQLPLPSEPIQPTIPGYEILGELGRGGMGVVYKARQLSLKRTVALKMLRNRDFAGPDELARFRGEAEAVAKLQHANIVQIYEIGEHLGKPYFSLEFVEGGSLAALAAGGPAPGNQAARLVETLARAMHAAHLRGIVHRDLKPANILLQIADVSSGLEPTSKSPTFDLQSAIPKIADFGLAKKLEGSTLQTQTGAVMGTPSFMAPEQAQGKSKEIGPAADIYALGGILYQLVTGRPPHLGALVNLEFLKQIVEEDPIPPRRLMPTVSPDLETICLKCLEKDPAWRYPTALALAEDLRRFQAHEPILARPITPLGRVRKWARRRPDLASLSAALLITALVAFTMVTWYWRRAENEWQRAENEWQRAEDKADAESKAKTRVELALADVKKTSYLHSIGLAAQEAYAPNIPRARAILQECPFELRHWEWYFVDHLCRLSQKSWQAHQGAVQDLVFSPDGKRLASASRDRSVKIWDAGSRELLLTLPDHPGPIKKIAFRPGGTWLAAASGQGDAEGGLRLDLPGQIKVWDAYSGQPVFTLEGHMRAVSSVAFAPDKALLASASHDKTIRIWDLNTAKAERILRDHAESVVSLAYSPDGKYLASADEKGAVLIWNTSTWKTTITGKGLGRLAHVTFSPDGKLLAICRVGAPIVLFQIEQSKELARLGSDHEVAFQAAFSRDGKYLVSAGLDQVIRTWELATKKAVLTLRGHEGPVETVVYDPDGEHLLSGGFDRTIKVWHAWRSPEARVFTGHRGPVEAIAFAADDKYLVTGSTDSEVKFWDLATGKETRTLKPQAGPVWGLALDRDGQLLATAQEQKVIKLWDAATGAEVGVLRGHQGSVWSVAFERTGERLVSASHDGTIGIWDPKAQTQLRILTGHQGSVQNALFSPDGRLVASAGFDHTVRLWDVHSGKELYKMEGHTGPVMCLAFSPDSEILASGGLDKTVRLWSVADGRLLRTLAAHPTYVWGMSFSPDGTRLLSACGHENVLQYVHKEMWEKRPEGGVPHGDVELKLWEVSTGREILSFRERGMEVASPRFSRTGHFLGAAVGTRAKVWLASTP